MTPVRLPLRVGARTVATLSRRLLRVGLSLDDALSGAMPALPPLGAADGYLVTALPEARLAELTARDDLRVFVRQRYRRSYAALDGGFDAFLAGLSAKTRSTLKRKVRRFAERSGGAIDVRCYRSPDEMAVFHEAARAVSRRTYQERLLDAGLPDGEGAIAAMRSLAQEDAVRAWLLFLDGQAISYLYAPAEGETLIYAYLGYDPAFSDLSPGTVLQAEAMRLLMDEGGFRLFDFTEGEGQHKRLFGTGGVDCVDLLLMRPTLANYATGAILRLFDDAIAFAKASVHRAGLGQAVSALRR